MTDDELHSNWPDLATVVSERRRLRQAALASAAWTRVMADIERMIR